MDVCAEAHFFALPADVSGRSVVRRGTAGHVADSDICLRLCDPGRYRRPSLSAFCFFRAGWLVGVQQDHLRGGFLLAG